MIDTPIVRQNDLTASIVVFDPMKKAQQSVSEVIVIDGPACYRPLLNLSEAGKSKGV